MTLIKTKMLVKIGVEFNAPPGHPTRYKAISEAVFTANHLTNKKAVLPQGNRAMPQVFFSVEVRQQHSLQV